MNQRTNRIVLIVLAMVGIVVAIGPLRDDLGDLSTAGQVAALVAVAATVWLAERAWNRGHR